MCCTSSMVFIMLSHESQRNREASGQPTWTISHLVSALASSFALGGGHSSLEGLGDFSEEARCGIFLDGRSPFLYHLLCDLNCVILLGLFGGIAWVILLSVFLAGAGLLHWHTSTTYYHRSHWTTHSHQTHWVLITAITPLLWSHHLGVLTFLQTPCGGLPRARWAVNGTSSRPHPLSCLCRQSSAETGHCPGGNGRTLGLCSSTGTAGLCAGGPCLSSYQLFGDTANRQTILLLLSITNGFDIIINNQ